MNAFNSKFIQVCTISDALVTFRGNQTQLALELKLNRGTLRTYIKNGGNQLLKVKSTDGVIEGFELINKDVKS